MNVIFLASIVFVMSSTVIATSAPRQHLDVACELGAEVLREQPHSTALVFDGTGYRQAAIPSLQDADIPPDLKQDADNARLSNVFIDCPSLVRDLPDRARMASDEDRGKVEGLDPAPGLYVTTIYTPLLDRRGTTALVYEFHKCAGLCGYGGLFIYKKIGGRWVRTERPLFSVMS